MRQSNISAKKIYHAVLSRIRQSVDSDRKLGEYFFPDISFQTGFSNSIRTISKGFRIKVLPHSKLFQSVCIAFFGRPSERCPAVSLP